MTGAEITAGPDAVGADCGGGVAMADFVRAGAGGAGSGRTTLAAILAANVVEDSSADPRPTVALLAILFPEVDWPRDTEVDAEAGMRFAAGVAAGKASVPLEEPFGVADATCSFASSFASGSSDSVWDPERELMAAGILNECAERLSVPAMTSKKLAPALCVDLSAGAAVIGDIVRWARIRTPLMMQMAGQDFCFGRPDSNASGH